MNQVRIFHILSQFDFYISVGVRVACAAMLQEEKRRLPGPRLTSLRCPDTPKSPKTPSRSQNPEGSRLTTPRSRRSRDSHVEKGHEHGEHHATFVEKGWARMTGKRSSRVQKE